MYVVDFFTYFERKCDPFWSLNYVNLSNISHTHKYTYSKTWYFDTIFIFARIYIFLINISWFSGFQLTKARVAQRSFILEKKKNFSQELFAQPTFIHRSDSVLIDTGDLNAQHHTRKISISVSFLFFLIRIDLLKSKP